MCLIPKIDLYLNFFIFFDYFFNTFQSIFISIQVKIPLRDSLLVSHQVFNFFLFSCQTVVQTKNMLICSLFMDLVMEMHCKQRELIAAGILVDVLQRDTQSHKFFFFNTGSNRCFLCSPNQAFIRNLCTYCMLLVAFKYCFVIIVSIVRFKNPLPYQNTLIIF